MARSRGRSGWLACVLLLVLAVPPALAFNGVEGEAFFLSLLNQADHPLSDEPACAAFSWRGSEPPDTLGEHLAAMLALGHDNDNRVRLSSQCEASRAETPDGKIVDVRDCQLNLVEETPDEDFVASTTLRASLLPDDGLLPGSLRCY